MQLPFLCLCPAIRRLYIGGVSDASQGAPPAPDQIINQLLETNIKQHMVLEQIVQRLQVITAELLRLQQHVSLPDPSKKKNTTATDQALVPAIPPNIRMHHQAGRLADTRLKSDPDFPAGKAQQAYFPLTKEEADSKWKP